jgi:ABC-type Fe3+/spermidine/putrescine transport system ATPase subunit
MLDEPLGALDRALREQLSHELRSILRETRVPAIYVTHDQEEANAIADRLLLLHDGVILQSGKPHEIYYHPRNVWVARFFGLGNLIAGEVVSTDPLRVKTPLGIIQASCDRQIPQPGMKTTLLFRPNQACSNPDNCENTITATVIDQVFQGETYLQTVRINEEVPMFNILSPEPVEPGEKRTFSYPARHVRCLENGNGEQ